MYGTSYVTMAKESAMGEQSVQNDMRDGQSAAQGVVTGYRPTEEDRRSLREWFARYDALSERPGIEEMADMGMFPMNLVTDGSDGEGHTAQWDREQYMATMGAVMGGGAEGGDGSGAGDVSFTSTRTPFFFSSALAVVFTEATMVYGGQTQEMHYADILVRSGGRWRFQTMVQSGWADMMRAAQAG